MDKDEKFLQMLKKFDVNSIFLQDSKSKYTLLTKKLLRLNDDAKK